MPLHGLLVGAGAGGQLPHGQLARVLHPLQQLRLGPSEVQHPAAGGEGPLLPGAVVRHVGEGQAEPGQLFRELPDLTLAGSAHRVVLRMIHRIRDGVQQLGALLLPAQGRVERYHVPAALLRPVVIDEPVLDRPGGVGQERAPTLVIGQHRLVKGQHGDAQLVLVAVLRGGMDELHRLRADKSHVLTDQGVRRLRVRLGRLYLGRDVVLCAHHCYPSIPLRLKDTKPPPDFGGHSSFFQSKRYYNSLPTPEPIRDRPDVNSMSILCKKQAASARAVIFYL